MLATKPVRQTTIIAAQLLAAQFQRDVNALVVAAKQDGEVPLGATLNMQVTPPVWMIPSDDDGPGKEM